MPSGQSYSCVAVYTLVIPVPRLALLSDYPLSYTGATSNLTAVGPSTCVQAPSQRLGNGTTVVFPGSGTCFQNATNSTTPPGVYVLSQVAPSSSSVAFAAWTCYDVTNGTAIPFTPMISVTNTTTNVTTNVTGFNLTANQAVTCVAVYAAAGVKLALISDYPSSYTGPNANLGSLGPGNVTCVQAPSQRLGVANVTVVNPGPGMCPANGTSGAGFYQLGQNNLTGMAFSSWGCYLISANGTAVGPVNLTTSIFNVTNNTTNSTTNVTLTGVTLQAGDTMTCVARYDFIQVAGPKLALLSSISTNGSYSGPGPNLTATGAIDTCVKAPSAIVGVNNVSITTPGPGQCGGAIGGGVMFGGTYNLSQSTSQALPGLVFVQFDCYNVTGTTSQLILANTSSITLAAGVNSSTTCVAVYNYTAVPLPKLALISNFIGNYSGNGGNLTALGTNDSCTKAPSPVLGVNNVTLVSPGPGLCGSSGLGFISAGTYSLTQSPPSSAVIFAGWSCYDVTNGTAVVLSSSGSITLPATSVSVTCAATYVAQTAPTPTLALISSFVNGNYSGVGANLTAIGPAGMTRCTQSPSPVLGVNSVTVLNPGSGVCSSGPNGSITAGTYSLSQTAPSAGVSFLRWECYNTTGGTAVLLFNTTQAQLVLPAANVSVTCVAVYTQQEPLLAPTLALVSSFTGASYTGPGANLSATALNDTCTRAPSPIVGVAGVTIVNPGPGLCGATGSGTVAAGVYSLTQSAPSGTVFLRWDCFNTTSGSAILLVTGVTTITITQSNTSTTCVAVYSVPVPVPPKLALVSLFNGSSSYTGPGGNLSAVGPVDSCVRAPSPIVGVSGVTILNPGPGTCGTDGTISAGTYTLSQSAPAGTLFNRFDCYNIVTGTAVLVSSGTNSITLTTANMSITCTAVYTVQPATAPKLALLSNFNFAYTGTTGGNLSAVGPTDSCIKAPSNILNTNNISVTAPGPGQCGGATGSMAGGTYSLSQVPPASNLTFVGWECYNITSGTQDLLTTGSSINLPANTNLSVTCVAVYAAQVVVLQAKLALISSFNSISYPGPGANLTGTGPIDTCIKAPSQILGRGGVTIGAPGAASTCNVSAGTYNLTQVAPSSGYSLDKWQVRHWLCT